MTPFDVYKTYLAIKNHFCKPSYDYHKYSGKTSCTLNSFYKRKDRFYFEKLSRQKSDSEIINFFVANFVSCDDPQTLWIGNIIKSGEENFIQWNKRQQSLTYIFSDELSRLLMNHTFKELFEIKSSRHPVILKEHLKKNVSLETLTILDKLYHYTKYFNKSLNDPIWEFIYLRIQKYHGFLHINPFKFKSLIKTLL